MAIITEITALIREHLPIIATVLVLVHLTRNYFTRGVSEVPGPFLARFSNLWRFIDVARGKAEETHLKLHQKYGQYVRLGPNLVSVQNLDALKVIYGVNKGYTKVSAVCLGVTSLIDCFPDEIL